MKNKLAGLAVVATLVIGIGFFAISNIAHAASTSTLNVIVGIDSGFGGTASPSDFTVTASTTLNGAANVSSFPGSNGSPTAITVDANTPYSVTASSLSNYTVESSDGCSGTSQPAGGTGTCVIVEQFISTTTSCVATTTYQNPSLAQLTIASSAISTQLSPSTTNNLVGAWNFTAYNSPVLLNSIKFTVIGSASMSDLQNVKLMVNGTQVGATLASVAQNGTATFTASSGTLTTLPTGANNIQVFADAAGSPSKNFRFEIANAADVSAADGHYCNAPITTNANDGTLITIEQGQLTITQDSGTPNGNIASGTSVTLAKFDLRAANEALNLKFLDFYLAFTGLSTTTTNLNHQIQNVSLVDGNGHQVGSVIAVPPSGNACSGGTNAPNAVMTTNTAGNVYADCFGTASSPISYTIPMNATTVFYLKADIEPTANFSTITAALSGDTNDLVGASSGLSGSSSGVTGDALLLTAGNGGGGGGGDTASSTDNSLSSLTVSDGATLSPAFNPTTLTYNVTLTWYAPISTTAGLISATVNNPNATEVITQAPSLPGTATVVVTAQSGATRTYTVNFTVAPPVTSVSAAPATNVAGTATNVTVTIGTVGLTDGTVATAELVNAADGSSLTPSVTTTGTVSSNAASLVLNVPASIVAGNYKIKVTVAPSLTPNTSQTYTVTAGSGGGESALTKLIDEAVSATKLAIGGNYTLGAKGWNYGILQNNALPNHYVPVAGRSVGYSSKVSSSTFRRTGGATTRPITF